MVKDRKDGNDWPANMRNAKREAIKAHKVEIKWERREDVEVEDVP